MNGKFQFILVNLEEFKILSLVIFDNIKFK